jgi:hypothetical protein
MWFRLALSWGCPVSEAQARCSSREFAEWAAYYRLEPWGEERADLRSGIIAHLIAGALSKKGRYPKLGDFLAGELMRRAKRRADPQLVAARLMEFGQAHNRSVRDGRHR